MQFKVLYAFALAASCAHCAKSAKIIPLSYWQEPEAAVTVSDAARERESNSRYYVGALDSLSSESPEYYRYSSSVRQRETPLEDDVDLEGQYASATPTDTEMQLFGHQRDARKMRQDVTTTKPRKKNKESLMSKILPMLVMPFLVSSTLIPMMLTSLKFMLLKSLFVGKIAIVLLALNALWKSDNRGGVYSHNVNYDYGHDGHEQKDLHKDHYGYNGDEEYGAYVNRRSARVTRFR